MRRLVAAVAVAASAVLTAVASITSPALAQAYPSKPIKFVIPFGPGSATDVLARIAGQDIAQQLGQPVVVIHKPGADGALSAIEVQRAAPDGCTFLFGTNSPLAVVPNMRKEPPYDVMKDFTPVTFLGENSFFFVVNPSLPVKSLAELVAYAKANPNKLNYATGNTYAIVSMAMFAQNNGIQMQMVPYKSEPDATVDLLSGQVHVMNSTATTANSQAQAGKLRVLATNGERSPLMPDVPSITEAGQPKFPVGPWFALVGPAGLPPEIVTTMHKAMATALAKAEVREPMQKQGFIPRTSTPEELTTFMKDQLALWKTVLKSAGVEQQ